MGKVSLSEDIIIERAKIINNSVVVNSCDYIKEEKRNRWRLNITCKVCNHTYFNSWDNFKKQGCPSCFKNNPRVDRRKYTRADIEVALEKNNMVLVDEYNPNTSMAVKCTICGSISKRNTTIIMSYNRGCKKCMGLEKKDDEIFRNEVFVLSNGEYEVLGEYVNRHTLIELRHKICNRTYMVTPHNYITGERRCPHCNISKGEREIDNILQANKVFNIREYSFDNLIGKNKTPYRFDFAIVNNYGLNCLIEYHGEGHYKPIDWVGKGIDWARKNLFEYQERDIIKEKYCRDNQIKLVIIPYWEFKNIEAILEVEGVI